MVRKIGMVSAALAALALVYLVRTPEPPPTPGDPVPDPAAALAQAPQVARIGGGHGAGEAPASEQGQPRENDSSDCSIRTVYLQNANGTVTTMYRCDRAVPVPAHPYAAYPDDTLASLAWGDAEAARVLGMRLRERDEAAALSLVIRAAALAGGDPAPILEYASAYPHPTEADGWPVQDTVRARYVLAAVAELLEPGSGGLAHWDREIRSASRDPARELAMLDARARQIVDAMRQISVEVTGDAGFGGRGDA